MAYIGNDPNTGTLEQNAYLVIPQHQDRLRLLVQILMGFH